MECPPDFGTPRLAMDVTGDCETCHGYFGKSAVLTGC